MSREDGCKCQGCGKTYKVDWIVPDDVWEHIKSAGKVEGAGLLCGSCIAARVEDFDNFGVFHCTPELLAPELKEDPASTYSTDDAVVESMPNYGMSRLDFLEQTCGEYCEECGWSMVFPGIGCMNCDAHKRKKELEEALEVMLPLVEGLMAWGVSPDDLHNLIENSVLYLRRIGRLA